MRRILASACLLGQRVRYDGNARTLSHPLLARWMDEGRVVPFCPECAAGLPTPRPPAEIAPGDDADAILAGAGHVRGRDGADLTDAFRAAAHRALETARAEGCGFALLADRSPSCGSRRIYAGGFDGTLRAGMGVTAALLARHGVQVFTETGIDALAAALDS